MSLCFDIILVYTVVLFFFVTKVLTLSAFLQICFLLL